MAQMLAMVVNELQNNWDVQLPQVEFAYNNSVSAAAGLAPNEVHMGRLSQAVCKLLSVWKIAISPYHPNGNGGVERVNYTMAQMLAMVVNELHNNCCLLYTSPSPRDLSTSRMPSSA